MTAFAPMVAHHGVLLQRGGILFDSGFQSAGFVSLDIMPGTKTGLEQLGLCCGAAECVLC